jgi:L-ribulose-5-phosphate 3-epimerase UlaE
MFKAVSWSIEEGDVQSCFMEYRRTSNMLVFNTCIDKIACVISVCLCLHRKVGSG